jgi:hypothetical protein
MVGRSRIGVVRSADARRVSPSRRRGRPAGPDLDLLTALDDLTQRQLRVDVAVAWKRLHGHQPAAGDWMMIRTTVARLEREGLIHSDPSLAIEVTDAGRAVLRDDPPG